MSIKTTISTITIAAGAVVVGFVAAAEAGCAGEDTMASGDGYY